ncbi:uncharacterized protein LOC115886229 [Sitophilus oryzae]|uniref:Uncharacterized protein LOC115886229 n=1 Tax=Sitophilus oryzae TaxID=7048 RepID=A0A6J2YCN0_SITOR|nr:uncharacterized protein LOC115886229 [Sitophilus oryzae]
MFQEIYDEINFDQFRDYFENGLHPSYDKYYYMLSSRDMDFTALKSIIFKLSDLKDRSSDCNTLARSSHFYEGSTNLNNSASENNYKHNDYYNYNSDDLKRNERQVEHDSSYNGHRVEDIDNVRGKSGHENKNYRYNNTDEYNFNTNYERRQQKLIEDNRTKSFEQNPPLVEDYQSRIFEQNPPLFERQTADMHGIFIVSEEHEIEENSVNICEEDDLDSLNLESARIEEDCDALPVAMGYAQAEEVNDTLPVAIEFAQVEEDDALPVASEVMPAEDEWNTLPGNVEEDEIEKWNPFFLEEEKCNSSSVPMFCFNNVEDKDIPPTQEVTHIRSTSIRLLDNPCWNRQFDYFDRKTNVPREETRDEFRPQQAISCTSRRMDMMSKSPNAKMAKDIIIHPSHPPWTRCL